MFHCFNISKHISISVLFFIISVSCSVFFAGFLKIIALGLGSSTIFLPQESGFRTFFVHRGWEICPLKKFPGGLPWGWSGLELTDK